MAALAARIAARRSTFGSGGTVNSLDIGSSAGSLVEGCDVEVGEGATPDWEAVGMRGGAGADTDAEEGNGGTITIGRGVVGWDWCS